MTLAYDVILPSPVDHLTLSHRAIARREMQCIVSVFVVLICLLLTWSREVRLGWSLLLDVQDEARHSNAGMYVYVPTLFLV